MKYLHRSWMVGVITACIACAEGEVALMFSEVLPRNTDAAGGVVDRKGGSADWFELYNPLPEPITVRNIRIEGPDGSMWSFPPGTVLRGDMQVLIFADGTSSEGTELHTPFDLRGAGSMALWYRNAVLHEVEWPALVADHSWARMPNGGVWMEDPTPTPLAPNEL